MEQPSHRSPGWDRPQAQNQSFFRDSARLRNTLLPASYDWKTPARLVCETGTEHFIPGNRRLLDYFTGFQRLIHTPVLA